MDDSERLARLISSKNYPTAVSGEYEPIRRKQLFPNAKKPISNVCGNADGVSVDRMVNLTEDNVWQRSCDRVSGKPDAEPKGALLALAIDLRNITLEGLALGQLVYIYDDPMPSNPQHSVIRGNDQITRARQDELRSLVSNMFREHISGPSNH